MTHKTTSKTRSDQIRSFPVRLAKLEITSSNFAQVDSAEQARSYAVPEHFSCTQFQSTTSKSAHPKPTTASGVSNDIQLPAAARRPRPAPTRPHLSARRSQHHVFMHHARTPCSPVVRGQCSEVAARESPGTPDTLTNWSNLFPEFLPPEPKVTYFLVNLPRSHDRN